MRKDMGASADADRAATPSEPSPTVSGIAGIPSAANCWLSKIPDTDIYAVVGPDGRDIGYVRKVYRTIEKEIPGKRYVAWRRKAKTPSWRLWLKGDMERAGSLHRDTRKAAVEELLRDYAIAMEAAKPDRPRSGLDPEGDSAGPKDIAQTTGPSTPGSNP